MVDLVLALVAMLVGLLHAVLGMVPIGHALKRQYYHKHSLPCLL